MIEFDVDMGYMLECDELDKVVLNDENGDHEPMEFVPKDVATVGAQGGTIDMDWVRDLVERHSDHIEGGGRAFHNGAYERMAEEIAATVDAGPDEPDETTMLKLHDRMNAALLEYESAMGIENGNGANTVPFVVEMHQIIEDAATVGVGTCQIEERHGDWYCTGCGEMVGAFDPASELCIDGNAIELWRHCPSCGREITE